MICPARGNTLGHTERLTTGTGTPTASAWFWCRESRLACGGCPVLTDDLLRELPPTTSMSTPSNNHTSPLTCGFRLAEAP